MSGPDEQEEPYWRPSGKTVSKAGVDAFASRLHLRMVELGMSQADLARKVFGLDAAGKVKGRDKISLYLRAGGLPGEGHMRKIARAVSTSLAELAPRIDTTPLERAGKGPPRSRLKFDANKAWPVGGKGSDPGRVNVEPRPGGEIMLCLLMRSNEDAMRVIAFFNKLDKNRPHE